MCGRFVNRHAKPARYNIAPGTSVGVVRGGAAAQPEAMTWGFAPQWLRDPSKSQINARAETVLEKPMFRDSFRKRRCLVPADGWYEWARDGDTKQPWFFQLVGGAVAHPAAPATSVTSKIRRFCRIADDSSRVRRASHP